MASLASALAANQAQERFALSAGAAVADLPLDRAVRVLRLMQQAAALVAVRSIGDMLDEQGIEAPPVATVDVRLFAGTSATGYPVEAVLTERAPAWQKSLFAQTAVHDAARMAARAAIVARPEVKLYVRQTDGNPCGRCAILAGRVYKWNDGFARHPKCGCTHVPTSAPGASRLITSPREYFDGLTPAQQETAFGKKNAAAIREGADPVKLVNAYRDAARTRAKFSPEVVAANAATREQGIAALMRLGILRAPRAN